MHAHWATSPGLHQGTERHACTLVCEPGATQDLASAASRSESCRAARLPAVAAQGGVGTGVTAVRAGEADARLAELLRRLNERQRAAVLAPAGAPLLVAAGPGSGKTSAMLARVAFLLAQGLAAENILVVSYTTNAAAEFRTRLAAAAGPAAAAVHVATFHSLALSLIKEFRTELGRSRVTVVSGREQHRVAEAALARWRRRSDVARAAAVTREEAQRILRPAGRAAGHRGVRGAPQPDLCSRHLRAANTVKRGGAARPAPIISVRSAGLTSGSAGCANAARKTGRGRGGVRHGRAAAGPGACGPITAAACMESGTGGGLRGVVREGEGCAEMAGGSQGAVGMHADADREQAKEAQRARRAKQQARDVLAEISSIKASGAAAADVLRSRGARAAGLHGFYCACLAAAGRVDLDDLVPLAARLLRGNPAVTATVSERYQAVILDEFQDTSAVQFALLTQLASHRRVTAVGDDDQSIFAFSGAQPANFLRFLDHFGPLRPAPAAPPARPAGPAPAAPAIPPAAAAATAAATTAAPAAEVATDTAAGAAARSCMHASLQTPAPEAAVSPPATPAVPHTWLPCWRTAPQAGSEDRRAAVYSAGDRRGDAACCAAAGDCGSVMCTPRRPADRVGGSVGCADTPVGYWSVVVDTQAVAETQTQDMLPSSLGGAAVAASPCPRVAAQLMSTPGHTIGAGGHTQPRSCVRRDAAVQTTCAGETVQLLTQHAQHSDVQMVRHRRKGGYLVALGVNYRCPGHVVEAASALVAANEERLPKQLEAAQSQGLPVELLEASDPQQQAAFVTAAACIAAGVVPPHPAAQQHGVSAPAAELEPPQRVGDMPGNRSAGAGDAAPNCAILYRQRKSGRAFQALLRACGVPFNHCATPPLLTRGLRDAAAALTILAFRGCTGAFPAGLQRGSGGGRARPSASARPPPAECVAEGQRAGMRDAEDTRAVHGEAAAADVGVPRQNPSGAAGRCAVADVGESCEHAQSAWDAHACEAVNAAGVKRRADGNGGVGLPWKRGREPAWLKCVAGRPGVPHALATAGLRLFRAFLEEEACMKRTDGGIGSEAPHPAAAAVRHLVACARRWHGPTWRLHIFSAADRLFSSRASGTLRAAELSAAQRALACLRGYLAHAAGCETLHAAAAAAVAGLPRRRGLDRPLCAELERDGVLLNAAVDERTGAEFLELQVTDFLAGCPSVPHSTDKPASMMPADTAACCALRQGLPFAEHWATQATCSTAMPPSFLGDCASASAGACCPASAQRGCAECTQQACAADPGAGVSCIGGTDDHCGRRMDMPQVSAAEMCDRQGRLVERASARPSRAEDDGRTADDALPGLGGERVFTCEDAALRAVRNGDGHEEGWGGRGDTTDALPAFVLWLTERAVAASEARRAADARAVTLTTLHRSKGREWDHVFLVDAAEGQLPLRPPPQRGGRDAPRRELRAAQARAEDAAEEAEADVSEERRLLYVGMTRAKRTLCVLWSATDARGRPTAASPFLAELPQAHCRWGSVSDAVVSESEREGGVEWRGAPSAGDGGEAGGWGDGVRVGRWVFERVAAAGESLQTEADGAAVADGREPADPDPAAAGDTAAHEAGNAVVRKASGQHAAAAHHAEPLAAACPDVSTAARTAQPASRHGRHGRDALGCEAAGRADLCDASTDEGLSQKEDAAAGAATGMPGQEGGVGAEPLCPRRHAFVRGLPRRVQAAVANTCMRFAAMAAFRSEERLLRKVSAHLQHRMPQSAPMLVAALKGAAGQEFLRWAIHVAGLPRAEATFKKFLARRNAPPHGRAHA
eukprot:jgi/Ulvmu1/5507/UM023_0043.1